LGAAPPIFLATGDADDTVYPRNTHRLADTLRRIGARVEERSYPNVGHPGILLAISLPFQDTAPVLDDVDAFMRAHD
jgi:acetyl esterase/lipase